MFANVSHLIEDHWNRTSNGTAWLSHDEVEHLLGDPDVDHTIALFLGLICIFCARRLPQLLGFVASVSLGLWTALVLQNSQAFDQPLFGKVHVPEGLWVPILAGFISGAIAAVLCYVAWRVALVLLTASVLMLLALATCRLANVSPEHVFEMGASLLSAYRVVGAVVLVVGILISALAVRRCHAQMIAFASAHMGTLLLLSAISHFAARLGSQAPFSLLEDLARIISEVRGGRCHIWEGDADAGSEQCACEAQCRTEISAWMLSSLAVLTVRFLLHKFHERAAKRKGSNEEERAPLSKAAASLTEPAEGGAPAPQVVGAAV